jgi:pimeloyl-ACP methyl ester carboxylesterase
VPDTVRHHDITLGGLRLHYRSVGQGPPVLLLHGWPTSSFLYRDVMPHLVGRRAIALDLPGFGESDKPLDRRYTFPFFDEVLDRFTEALGIKRTGLVVHDLGGPVGLHWAVQRPERIERLALLNTLVYPQMSAAVVAFLAATRVPGVAQLLTSPGGLRWSMALGMRRKERLTKEVIQGVQAPFRAPAARKALLATVHSLHPGGFQTIQRRLPEVTCPVRLIYGARDRILPDVGRTMARVQEDLPQAELTAMPDCGHFLQEDAPDEVGGLLGAFFAD